MQREVRGNALALDVAMALTATAASKADRVNFDFIDIWILHASTGKTGMARSARLTGPGENRFERLAGLTAV